MSFEIVCPAPAALATPPAQACPFRMDQIVRLAFRRINGVAAAFATEAALKLQATWTPLIAAADSTKIVISPLFAGLVIPNSEGIFIGGGDNTTFNGIRSYMGEAFVTVTFTWSNMTPAVKAVLDTYAQESIANAAGLTNLGVHMFNVNGWDFHNNLAFFPVYNFRVSSRGTEGLNTNDTYQASFDLAPRWDANLAGTKLSFDPLTAF